jgi:hypothetical protein
MCLECSPEGADGGVDETKDLLFRTHDELA